MAQVFIEDWPQSVWQDFAHMICGDRLGHGIGRNVYVLATDETKVIKIEITSHSFQNVNEWDLWTDLKDTKYAKYLAPCHMISPCGMVLIQSRVQPLTTDFEKVRLPDFLTDFKRGNYGLLDGRVVCHDYGTHVAAYHGALRSKMRQPKWWDE